MNLKFEFDDYSNVISTKTLNRESIKTLKFLSNSFAKTLGPYGMNTILEDKFLQHRVTKDGFTVYRNMVIYNKIGRVIARMIQKVSASLNETSGDGTTSSVVVANELYRLKKLIRKYKITPKLLVDVIKFLAVEISKDIEENKYSIEKIIEDYKRYTSNNDTDNANESYEKYYDIIKNLASISLNNDYASGSLVADIFTQLSEPGSGAINVEISATENTYFEKDRGFEIFRGMITSEMVNQPDGRTAIHNNPLILLVQGTINTEDITCLREIMNYVLTVVKKPLVIFAGGFSKQVTESIRSSIISYRERKQEYLDLLCIEIDTESTLGISTLLDIEANVGAEIIKLGYGKAFPKVPTPELYTKYFGSAKKIICQSTSVTRIVDGLSNSEKVKFRISEIDKQLDTLKSEQYIDHYNEIFKLNKRKACLLNDMITLYIGGRTIEEKEANRDLFDDAVRGTKSAVRNGVCRGGNLIVAQICDSYLSDNNIIDKLATRFFVNFKFADIVDYDNLCKLIKNVLYEIKEAYIRTYAIVLNNKFNNKRKSYKLAKGCIDNNNVYNLISGSYENWNMDDDSFDITKKMVINSIETDTQILSVATSILELLIASNQFIRTPKVEEMRKNL